MVRRDSLEARIPSRYDPDKAEDPDFVFEDEEYEEELNERDLSFCEVSDLYEILEGSFAKFRRLKKLHSDTDYDGLTKMMKEFSEELELPMEKIDDVTVLLMKRRQDLENVGYCLLSEHGDHYHIDQVFIEKDSRGMRLLSYFIYFIEKKAKEDESSALGISLFVQKNNHNAINKYQGLGFKMSGTNGEEYRMIKPFLG